MFTVDLKCALLEDGGRFLFDPTAEAVPTHVDGKAVTGIVAGPSVEVDVESDASQGDWKKIRKAVNAVLAEGRPDAGAEPAPAAPAHPWSGV